MLSEYKQIYEKNIVDDTLKTLDKNELIRQYVDTGNEKFLSAAIYKFWYILNNKLSSNRNNKFVEPEDFYNLYIDSILETCKNKLWKDENHTLYNDDKAPEKSINTIFNSKIINYFHACNRQKRKLSFDKFPISEYYEMEKSSYYQDVIKYMNRDNIFDLVVDLFNKKEYYCSYIVDLIVNNNIFDDKSNELKLNKKKLKHCLMNLNSDYFKYFSEHYNIDLDKVMSSSKYFSGVSYEQVEKKIETNLKNLSHNDSVIKFLSFYKEVQ